MSVSGAQPASVPVGRGPSPGADVRLAAGRLSSVDALRGVAVLAVVAAHAFNHGGSALVGADWFLVLRRVVEQGVLGVPLFFVISGFCIHLPWARQRAAGNRADLRFGPFWARRLRRLYPPYFAALCLSILAVCVAWWLRLGTATVARYAEPVAASIGWDFLAHATMLHGLLLPYDLGAGNPPLWTLAREEYLYLLYFVVLAWRVRFGLRPALAIVWLTGMLVPLLATTAIAASALDPEWQQRVMHPVHPDASALALWIQWCLGMAIAESYCGLISLPAWSRRPWMAALWAGVALVAQGRGWSMLTPVLWGLTFFTLVHSVVSREIVSRERVAPEVVSREAVAQETGGQSTRGRVGWLARIGLVSYSVYLIHSPLIGGLNQLELASGVPAAWLRHPAYHLVVWVLLIAACAAAGHVFFLTVERWFLNAPRQAPLPFRGGPGGRPA